MGKTLKTVGMVIGAAALIATGAGALLMPGLAGSVTLFGVSAGTLNMVSAGLTAVGGLLEKPQSSGSGSPEDWTASPDQPTPFAFGRVGIAGKRIHRDEFGSDNFRQGIVSVYSGAGPIKSFVSYKADDLSVSFTGAGDAIGKYAGQMWRVTRLGAQPDTALNVVLPGGQQMPAWDSRYKLSGKACDLLVVQQDSKFSVYPSGVPTPTVVLEGIYGYDPRYDSTYPGGAGTCRLGVRATYRWIDNPIIAALNWALGLVENGQVVGGVGASIQGIDVPAFVEAANIADANNWKVTAWPDTSEDVSSVLKQFLQAGGAAYARHAGKISCVSRGAARASVVTITARDTCGPLELDTGSSSFNRLNTITPEFMSEAHGWKEVPADPVTFASLRTEDGGKKSDSIKYRFVPAVKQAGQLAAYDILDAREPFSGTIPLKPHLRRLKRGDCFLIDEPGFLLDGVKCMVLSRTYQAQTGEVRIAFRSESDGKHDLALGKTTTMPDYPGLTPADPTLVSPPLPGDWTIVIRPPSPGGGLVPGFDLGGGVSNGTATAIQVEWWEVPAGIDPNDTPPSDANWQSAGTWPPTASTIPISVQPDRHYWIALTYFRNQNRSDRTLSGPWLSGMLVAGDVIPTAPTIAALNAELAALEALQASETVIREEQISELTAALPPPANMLVNSSLVAGTANWTMGPWTRIDDTHGPGFRVVSTGGAQVATSGFGPAAAEVEYTLSGEQMAAAFTGGTFNVLLEYWNDTARIVQLVGLPLASGESPTAWKKKAFTSTAPVGTTRFRVLLVNTASPAGVEIRGRRFKFEKGVVATDWTDDSGVADLRATVSQQSLAIIDLESNQALAKFELVAAATGGKPARFKLVSSSLGSAIALDAPWIYWGDNTVFDDATDTVQTTTGGRIRVIAWGSPFGASGNLLEWWGPTGIALSAMTTANGYNGRMTTSPYVFENAIAPTVFSAWASPASITANRATAGSLTTGAVTIFYSNPKGAVTVSWERFFGGVNGFGTAVVNSPTALTTTFTKTVGGAERSEVLFVANITDAGSGQKMQITVPVVFTGGPV